MRNSKKGFTIVELVTVIAVIAILAAVLIPTFSGIIESANVSAAEQEARNAYTNYLAEHASSGDFKEKVCVKTSKGYYVFLNSGSVVTAETTKDAQTVSNGKVGNYYYFEINESGGLDAKSGS